MNNKILNIKNMYKLLNINNPNWIVNDIIIKPFYYTLYIHNIHPHPTLNSKEYQIVIHRKPDGYGYYPINSDGVYDHQASGYWFLSVHNFQALLNNLIIQINKRYLTP